MRRTAVVSVVHVWPPPFVRSKVSLVIGKSLVRSELNRSLCSSGTGCASCTHYIDIYRLVKECSVLVPVEGGYGLIGL